MPGNYIRGLLLKALVALVSCAVALAVCEIIGRTAGRSFLKERARLDAWPIFYRLPDKPVGDIYFCRSGPACWSGQVLHQGLKMTCGVEDYYRDEPSITVRYDADGFRNAPGLADWDVAVAGDSFVELGYLQDSDLFTSEFARQAGVRVKNLGAAGAAPLTCMYYLSRYGRAASTRHAFMVFFEGNDIRELAAEQRALDRWAATGKREYRRGAGEGSVLGIAKQGAVNMRRGIRAFLEIRDCARFDSAEGPVPVTLDYAPPGSLQLTEHERDLLEAAVARWGELARQFGMTPWVLYMPCKRRVLDGAVHFPQGASQRETGWRPGDLPVFVGQLCSKHRIEFVDPTQALREETRRGRLTFNPVWDTHLNRLGASVVAKVMADRYAELIRRQPEGPAGTVVVKNEQETKKRTAGSSAGP